MIGAICTMTLGILGIRSLTLLFSERGRPIRIRILDALFALFFLVTSAAAFLFLGITAQEQPFALLLSLVIAGTLITITLFARFRSPYRARPNLLTLKVIGVLALMLVTMSAVMVSGFRFLTEDVPLYRIRITGVVHPEVVEWKSPEGVLRRESLPAYEVKFETPDGEHVAVRHVYGDEVAVKAKVLRFKPILNAMGIRNLCRIDYIYNGYKTAERHNAFPHRAQEIETSHPWLHPFQARFWAYWENTYFLRSGDPWLKSATLESNFFPLVDEEGTPFRGGFFLTITPGGLSAVPLP